MSTLYLIKPGFVEDTVLYEVELKEVGRLSQVTQQELLAYMEENGMKHIIVDSIHPRLIDEMWKANSKNDLLFLPITGRLGRI